MEYGDYTESDAIDFITSLSQRLIAADYNIISGFGLGIGSAVITGALQEIYINRKIINDDRLLLRPFPQGIKDDTTRKELWKQYREDMISRAGISVYLFGNKLDNGHIVPANGVKSEYEIAVDKHNLIVPVGCTGYVAQEIWNEVNEKLDAYYTNVDKNLKKAFAKLNEKTGKEELIENIIAFIELFKKGKYKPI